MSWISLNREKLLRAVELYKADPKSVREFFIDNGQEVCYDDLSDFTELLEKAMEI